MYLVMSMQTVMIQMVATFVSARQVTGEMEITVQVSLYYVLLYL